MRYIFFSGHINFPMGGAIDIVCSSDDLSYLLHLIDKNGLYIDLNYKDEYINYDIDNDEDEWWHIYDTNEMKITHASKMHTHYYERFDINDKYEVIYE